MISAVSTLLNYDRLPSLMEREFVACISLVYLSELGMMSLSEYISVSVPAKLGASVLINLSEFLKSLSILSD